MFYYTNLRNDTHAYSGYTIACLPRSRSYRLYMFTSRNNPSTIQLLDFIFLSLGRVFLQISSFQESELRWNTQIYAQTPCSKNISTLRTHLGHNPRLWASRRIFWTEFVLTNLQLMQNLSPVTSGPYCKAIFIIPLPDWRMWYIWHLRLLHQVTFCSIYRNHTARSDWIKPLDFWLCDLIVLSLISCRDNYSVITALLCNDGRDQFIIVRLCIW